MGIMRLLDDHLFAQPLLRVNQERTHQIGGYLPGPAGWDGQGHQGLQVLGTAGAQFLQGSGAVLGAIIRHQGGGVGHHESQRGVIHALEAIKGRFQVVIDQGETVLIGESRQSRRER